MVNSPIRSVGSPATFVARATLWSCHSVSILEIMLQSPEGCEVAWVPESWGTQCDGAIFHQSDCWHDGNWPIAAHAQTYPSRLHRPDPIMMVAEPSFVVELAYVKLSF
jgi:hypothetical protein